MNGIEFSNEAERDLIDIYLYSVEYYGIRILRVLNGRMDPGKHLSS